jgi:hypothetical protein
MRRLVEIHSLGAGMEARSHEPYSDLSHLVLTSGRQPDGESVKGARSDDKTGGSVPLR